MHPTGKHLLPPFVAAGPASATARTHSRFEGCACTSSVCRTQIGGRWNSPGPGVAAASRSFARAMLEGRARAGIGPLPRTHVGLELRIAAAASVLNLEEADRPPDRDAPDCAEAGAVGDAWLRAGCSTVLVVASVVARLERDGLIQPAPRELRAHRGRAGRTGVAGRRAVRPR